MDEQLQTLCDGIAAACAGVPAERLPHKFVRVPAGVILELLQRAGINPATPTEPPATEPEE